MSDIDLSPLALGQLSYGISVKELTAAYSIFQNEGVFTEPRLYTEVKDSSGETILSNEKKSEIVISEQSASVMTKMLYNVVNDPEGTASGTITLKNSVDVAGKTGTTTADFDRWFVGFTPYYVGGVWVGYDMNIALSAFGASPAAIVWNTVMTKLHQKYLDAAANGTEELRTFKTADGLTDAQYVYRDLPAGVEPGGWYGIPFFYNTLKPGEYCGSSDVTYQANAYCWFNH